jgi:hypothetical protein
MRLSHVLCSIGLAMFMVPSASSDDCTIVLGQNCCETVGLPGYSCLCNGQLQVCDTIVVRDDVHEDAVTRPFGWDNPDIGLLEPGCCEWIVPGCVPLFTPCGCTYDPLNTAWDDDCPNYEWPPGSMDCP